MERLTHSEGRKKLDFRSDTLTKPTPSMQAAMMSAEVGDSYYDEDPSVLKLQKEVATLFGKEAALFMPTGTMSNQVGLRLHCRAGDALFVGASNHVVQYETGALAGVNGIQHMEPPLKDGFKIDERLLEESLLRASATHSPVSAAVSVENTHLRSGGRIYPFEDLKSLSKECRKLGIPLHLDGARIWHAHVVEGFPLSDYGALFETVSVCFSKGLGAPVGSCLLGTEEHIRMAKRYRKMMGGSMRQCGYLAAAASFALSHHMERLKIDHANAKLLARFFRTLYPDLEVGEPETNIVLVRFASDSKRTLSVVQAELWESFGMRWAPLDSRTLRAVTHLDICNETLRKTIGAVYPQLLETEY